MIIHRSQDGHISTSDTSLVAYLKIKGIKPLSLTITDKQAVFDFEATQLLHETTIHYYSNADMMLSFYRAYRDTLNDIHKAQKSEAPK
jgi:hypothetical protein